MMNRFPPIISDAFNELATERVTKKYMSLRNGAIGQLWQGADKEISRDFGSAFPAYAMFTNQNKSQFHREHQARYVGQAMANLRTLTTFLNGEMARLSTDDSKAHWSLRPPHTFVMGSGLIDPTQMGTQFFDNIDIYRTEAQTKISAFLQRHGLYNQLFNMRQEDIESFYPLQQDYFRWWKMAATAVFTHPKLPVTLAIIPDGIPPFMFRNPNYTVPFYGAPPLDPLCLLDSCYFIWNLSVTDGSYNSKLLHETNIDSYLSEFRLIGAAMQLAAMNLHIICSAMPVGRGNRKPQWLRSPANHVFVKITSLAMQNFAETLSVFGIERAKPSTQTMVF